jgi:hypothetical protein
MAYTTVGCIGVELQQTFDASSTPTCTTVANWITEAEAEIEELSGTKFGTGSDGCTVTAAIIPFTSDTAFSDNNNRYWGLVAGQNLTGSIPNAVFLQDVSGGPQRRPIVSITSLGVNGSSSFGNAADSFTALTENTGSGGSYFLDKETGKIVFTSCGPIYGHPRAICTTYKYGYSAIPATVQQLSTKMVARRILATKANLSQFSSIDSFSLDGLSISKNITQSVNYMQSLDLDIKRLQNEVVGAFKVDVVR